MSQGILQHRAPILRDGPSVVLVDAYTSGKYLAGAFRARGARVVHVQSTQYPMPSMPAPDLSDCTTCIYSDSIDEMLTLLSALSPVAVLAGQEPGVELADQLAVRLGVASNGEELSYARRDKYEMVQALGRAGLRHVEHYKSNNPDLLVSWFERRKSQTVVIKPRRSAASDSVFVCRTAADVARAAQAVLDGVTIYGEPNSDVLAQDHLEGHEYVVDMVSNASRRYVCGVWRYEKRLLPSGRNIYHTETLLHEQEAPVAALISYVSEVLDALGIVFGPSHAEVIDTLDGPCLVEVGARLSGNMHPEFHDASTGANQATVSALAAMDPAGFHAQYADRCYQRLSRALCLTTSTDRTGLVQSIDRRALSKIESLPSVYRLDLKYGPGQIMRPTEDLYSSTMRIHMLNDDAGQLSEDCSVIEQMKDEVFQLRDSPAQAASTAQTGLGGR